MGNIFAVTCALNFQCRSRGLRARFACTRFLKLLKRLSLVGCGVFLSCSSFAVFSRLLPSLAVISSSKFAALRVFPLQHSKGVMYAFAGIWLLSPDTVLLRATDELPSSEVLFWRNLLATLTLLIFTFVDSWRNQVSGSHESIFHVVKQKFSTMNTYGYIAAVIYAACNICFLFAVKVTYAANVLVIISTSSIFAAITSYFLLNERLNPHTLVACLVCFGAILFIFSDQVLQSNSDGEPRDDGFSRESQVVGNVLALAVSLGSGVYFTLLRHIVNLEGNIDLIPVNILSCGIVTIVSMCLANNGCTRMGHGETSIMTSGKNAEIVYLLLQGVVSIPFSYSFLTHASTMIKSAEVGIIMTLETILGPLWVWMGGFERPPTNTLYGGIIIILTLCFHEWYNLRTEAEGDQISVKYTEGNATHFALELSESATGAQGGVQVADLDEMLECTDSTSVELTADTP